MVKYFKILELNGLKNMIFPFNIRDFSGEGGLSELCLCNRFRYLQLNLNSSVKDPTQNAT